MTPTNVLIIDDSKMITRLTAKILLSNKISNYFFHEDYIYIAYDGMQAIEILSKYPNISLLISDIMMPELNGHELIEILIDTGKIKTLDVIFITTPINTKIISKKISENIKGVIYKPFSAESFSDFFNNLEREHERKIQYEKKIKSDHAKQMKYIRTWVQNYCDEDKIDIQSEALETLIRSEFDHFYAIDADELYMTCQIVLENYIKSIDNSLAVNSLLMEKIYNIWRHPEKYKALGMRESLDDIMLNAEAFSNSMPIKEHLKYSFILPLNRLLTKVRDMAKDKQKLLHDDFTPYLDKLLDIFLEIDSNYKNMEVLSILNHIKEIEEFQEELKPLLQKSNLIDK
ncbi:MAG: response regulator, partial [Sulfurimonas sp.]|nr:response regulator [Sulfurimonas sp.]